MCLRDCHNVDVCREWSVRHEYFGFWAGMTEQERREERRRQGIVFQDPQVRDYILGHPAGEISWENLIP